MKLFIQIQYSWKAKRRETRANPTKEDIYAIGDDYNNFDMLKFAIHRIAMGHAPSDRVSIKASSFFYYIY